VTSLRRLPCRRRLKLRDGSARNSKNRYGDANVWDYGRNPY